MQGHLSINGINFTKVKVFAIAILAAGLMFSVALGQDQEPVLAPDESPVAQSFADLRAEAEVHYGNKSYSLAKEVYGQALKLELTPSEARWVRYRLSDTLWRVTVAGGGGDYGPIEKAHKDLEKLALELEKLDGPSPILWADIQESLGDSWWFPPFSRNLSTAWTHYQRALDFWANSKDLETARSRYLGIVWKAAGNPDPADQYYGYWYGNILPIDVLENVLKIAVAAEDQAHAHYLLAMALSKQTSRPQLLARVAEEYSAAINLGGESSWNDDALFQYAQWAARSGVTSYDDNGDLLLEPDYEKALSLYQRILDEFGKGETQYYRNAKDAIKRIIEPQLSVYLTHTYLPGSEPEIILNWRNLESVEISLYPIEMTKAIQFKNSEYHDTGDWLDVIDIEEMEAFHSFTLDEKAKRPYYRLSEQYRLDIEVTAGAYVVEAVGGSSEVRDLLLVTDAALVLKSTENEVLAFMCDSFTGTPMVEAEVVLWESSYDGRNKHINKRAGITDENGLVYFQFTEKSQHREYFASARREGRQAFALSQGYSYGYRQDFQWKVYAYADRPAYRPGGTAKWKIIARQHDADSYRVPTDEQIKFTLIDSRGQKVDEGILRLNAFGAAWGETSLTEEMSLGSYQIQLTRQSTGENIGYTQLFRLEEYKLPDFKVEIGIAGGDEEGPEVFRLGDTVTGKIQADYYFGGPVPNAEIEIVIYQSPFYHWWMPEREYSWLYFNQGDQNRYLNYGGPGSVIKRETLQTDSTGAASFSFDTPQSSDTDFQYTVEARVTDASRREITASKALKVTRQGYYVYLQPEHQIYQPGDTAEISVRTLDANSRPISADGRLRLTHEYWREIWTDDRGREISGKQMEELREKSGRRFSFGASSSDYRLKKEGYKTEEIEVTTVTTNDKGEAVYRIVVPKEGYFKVAWVSRENNGQPIKADTAFWASTEGSADIGYRPGGVSIVVDKDTFRPGEKAPVMISTPASGRTVLFSVGANNLQSYQILRMDGTVKLLYVDIGDEHIPNTFLEALMVSNHELFMEQKEIVVPPERNFLEIEVTADSEGYQPGEKGSYTLQATDWQGEPVSAEISLGLIDESVYYIQPDFASDIRQYFFGQKRYYAIQTSSTFDEKPYFKFEDIEKSKPDATEVASDTALPASEITFAANSSGSVKRGAYRQDTFTTAEELMGELEQFGRQAMSPMDAISEIRQEPTVQVRTDFRETVFWQPDILTDEDGLAKIEVTFPDSLTTWRATARGVAQKSRFGAATDTRQTRLPLIASLQTPRFFVTGDQLVVSGVFHNNTSVPMPVEALLEMDGGVETTESPSRQISIPANSQAQIDWRVAPKTPGEVKIKLTGRSRNFADAMEKTYAVYEHGIEKFIGKSGRLEGDAMTVSLDLPAERNKESTTLTVQVTPSLAVAMLDALPFLIDYPYGCTEQTLSRFLPSTLVTKTLRDLNLNPADIAGKIFGGLEKEYADATHQGGAKDLRELDKMVDAGLKRLYDFQHSDGGWGWWKEGATDPYMTAYVVWGLTLAEQAGVVVKESSLNRARSHLEKMLVEAEFSYDLQTWMLHALASRFSNAEEKRPSRFEAAAFLNLMRNREQLNAFTRALLALSAQYFGFEEEAKLLVQNLRDGVKIDRTPDQSLLLSQNGETSPAVMATAHWGKGGVYWRWSDGGVESTAFVLMALLAIEPESDLIEPTMNWLVKNRRGAHWSNTRDSAIVLMALNQYLETTSELQSDLAYEIQVNGHVLAESPAGGDDWLSGPSSWQVPGEWLQDGGNEVEIRRLSGQGSLYFSTQAEFFSLEEPVPPAGNEIFIKRDYHRIRAVPTLLKGFVEEKVPLDDGDTLESGDRVEVVLTIEGKNDYEYLMFEDLKPAGFEAVQIRSGEALFAKEIRVGELEAKGAAENERLTGRRTWVYQELRDRKVALFIDKLPEGFWEIRYRLRAETPGEFHALPVLGEAMYVPEIRANGAEIRLTVEDKSAAP